MVIFELLTFGITYVEQFCRLLNNIHPLLKKVENVEKLCPLFNQDERMLNSFADFSYGQIVDELSHIVESYCKIVEQF